MATAVSARLSAREGRRFAFTVGGAFLALAAVGRWRGAAVVPGALAVVGATLAAAGLVVPTRLGPVERAWSRFGHALSTVTTPVVMAVIYFGVLTPAGQLRRTFGGNPLVHDAAAGTYFKRRAPGARRGGDMRRQF